VMCIEPVGLAARNTEVVRLDEHAVVDVDKQERRGAGVNAELQLEGRATLLVAFISQRAHLPYAVDNVALEIRLHEGVLGGLVDTREGSWSIAVDRHNAGDLGFSND